MKNLIPILVIMLFLVICYPKNGMTQPTPDWIKGYRDNSLVIPVIDKQKADKQVGQQKFVNELTDKPENKTEIIKSGIGKEQFTDSSYVLEKARMQNGYYAQMTASKETILFTQEDVIKLNHSDMEWQEPLIRF